VFRHQHEADTGRTSSASHQIMGLDAAGRLVGGGVREADWASVVAASAKVCSA
jgi:GTPase